MFCSFAFTFMVTVVEKVGVRDAELVCDEGCPMEQQYWQGESRRSKRKAGAKRQQQHIISLFKTRTFSSSLRSSIIPTGLFKKTFCASLFSLSSSLSLAPYHPGFCGGDECEWYTVPVSEYTEGFNSVANGLGVICGSMVCGNNPIDDEFLDLDCNGFESSMDSNR